MNNDEDPEFNDPLGETEDLLNFDDEQDFFPKYYDLEKVFDEAIHPLLKTIINICHEYDIPMVSSFQYTNSESKVNLCTSVVLPASRTCEKITNAARTLIN